MSNMFQSLYVGIWVGPSETMLLRALPFFRRKLALLSCAGAWHWALAGGWRSMTGRDQMICDLAWPVVSDGRVPGVPHSFPWLILKHFSMANHQLPMFWTPSDQTHLMKSLSGFPNGLLRVNYQIIHRFHMFHCLYTWMYMKRYRMVYVCKQKYHFK